MMSDIFDNNNRNKKKKYIKKIRKLDEKCKNEIKICEKICDTIPFFYTYFNPMIKSKKMELAMIDGENEIIDTNALINEEQEVLIWKKNSSHYKEFHHFFMDVKRPQDIIVYLIDFIKSY